MLRTFQPGIRKNLKTSQPQKKFTGPYKKKRVYASQNLNFHYAYKEVPVIQRAPGLNNRFKKVLGAKIVRGGRSSDD